MPTVKKPTTPVTPTKSNEPVTVTHKGTGKKMKVSAEYYEKNKAKFDA